MSKSKTPAAKPAEEEVVTGQEPTLVTDEAVQEPGEAAQEPAEGSEVTQELASEEPGADPVAEEDQDGVPKLVKVQSLAKSTLRQPSSGWSIEPGKAREMLVDGWLENQLNAKLLQKV